MDELKQWTEGLDKRLTETEARVSVTEDRYKLIFLPSAITWRIDFGEII